MKVKFHKMLAKNYIVFPFCVVWETDDMMYYMPAKRLYIHFLCWHCVWTFIKEEKR